ncbi:unnamed protein product [Lampetra planeri]
MDAACHEPSSASRALTPVRILSTVNKHEDSAEMDTAIVFYCRVRSQQQVVLEELDARAGSRPVAATPPAWKARRRDRVTRWTRPLHTRCAPPSRRGHSGSPVGRPTSSQPALWVTVDPGIGPAVL